MSIKTATSRKRRDNLPLPSSACVSRDRAIAAALAAARQRAGISQRELSARLSRAHSFVAKIESGAQKLKVWELLDFADALDADAANLLREITALANAPQTTDDARRG